MKKLRKYLVLTAMAGALFAWGCERQEEEIPGQQPQEQQQPAQPGEQPQEQQQPAQPGQQPGTGSQ